MFSFLQQLVPKRREDLDADEDAYAESSAMPAFVPPAPLVKPPLTEEEIAEQEREAAEAEAREAAERAEAERLEQEALDDEKRRAEERLVQRQERARVLLEERAAERQRREEAHRAETGATLAPVPDLEPEFESESKPDVEAESEPETVQAVETHVVEAEPPAIEEDVVPVLDALPLEETLDDVYAHADIEHEEHLEHEDHLEDDDHLAHAADDFAFVPPAAHVEYHGAPDEHVEAFAAAEHVASTDAEVDVAEPASLEPIAHEEHVEAPVAELAPEPVEPDDHHVHAHVGTAPPAPAPPSESVPVPEAVERYTWPATLLHHEHAMQYGEAARRNLISMIAELNDAKLVHVLHDALYEERADGLRPEVLSALQRSYNGEEMRETYERFVRIGSDAERTIAREGIRSLDEEHA